MKSYFLQAYSAEGYRDFSPHVFQACERIYTMHSSDVVIMKQLLSYLEGNKNGEVILNPVNPKEVNGVILPDKKVAILNKDNFDEDVITHVKNKIKPLLKEEQMPNILLKKEMSILNTQVKKKETEILLKLKTAREFYQQLKKIVESAIITQEFETAMNKLKDRLLSMMSNHQQERNGWKDLFPKHLFTNATTCYGPFQTIHSLGKGIKHKWILKGQIGSYKSRILESLAEICEREGILYTSGHCPFEPSEMDALIIPEMELMVLDGDHPHESEISHPKDDHVDLSESCVDPLLILQETSALKEITAKYKQNMRQSVLLLQDLKKYKEQLYYLKHSLPTDPYKMDRFNKELLPLIDNDSM